MRMLKTLPIAIVVGAVVVIWLLGSSNPVTPAGYVGCAYRVDSERPHG